MPKRTIRQPLQDRYADDPNEEWEIDPEGVTVQPRLGAVISIRLDGDTARLIRKGAKQAGVSQSRFIRDAASDRAMEILASVPIVLPAQPTNTLRIEFSDNRWNRAVRTASAPISTRTTIQNREWSAGDPTLSSHRRRRA